ncbi:hypothetical protein K7I13_08185 [Brucepastera parasyntrophica]|uniref:hypothetical protein n=1 Tax=Brucepastera parasyntrophica TaxID=2880008 RepID=UPI0021095241|nr:hypothetical protein [Brucepastera parasyntrophica]ULQ58551.1 hypothetical protein K7I13_08185 [Brucepastera parasyntrophica]
MKRKVILIFTVIFFCANTGIYAQLGKFKEDVEAAESKSESKKEDKDEKEATKSSSSDSSSSSGMFELFFSLWFLTNGGVTYGEYPHHSNKFVYMGLPETYNISAQGTMQKKKNHWFSTEIQGFYMNNLGYGPWASFQGSIFRFFGPYLEAAMVMDGEDYLGIFRLGGTLSLLQTNPFSLSVYGEWLVWRGIMERSGGAFGLKMRSYLIKYIVLDARLGIQIFEYFYINEMEFKIGVMLNRWEISAGWRFWNMYTDGNDLVERYNGPFVGVGVYF